MRKIVLLFFCITILGVSAKSEKDSVFSFDEILLEAILNENEFKEAAKRYEHVTIVLDGLHDWSTYSSGSVKINPQFLQNKFPERLNNFTFTDSTRIKVAYGLVFIDCEFIFEKRINQEVSNDLYIENIEFKKLSFLSRSSTNIPWSYFKIENCEIDTFTFAFAHETHVIEAIDIRNSTINGLTFISGNDIQKWIFVESIFNGETQFKDGNTEAPGKFFNLNSCTLNLSRYDYGPEINRPAFNLQTHNSSVNIRNCFFLPKDDHDFALISISNNQSIELINNNFECRAVLKAQPDQTSFIEGNSFSGIDLYNFTPSETDNYFPFNQFSKQLLPRSNKTSFFSFKAPHQLIYENPYSYAGFIKVYKNLWRVYQYNGETENANLCYAEMKLEETQYWKYLFEQNKSFESFFRWQLNSFLSYFTDYGTNPAKAVIKSGWVILLFAIFYLFFPSDWDVSNRSQLLSKVKDLASKNRKKSFIATLAFVAYSGFIHILNALTLSLNAFTTLGFGDIPTHGAARYVTIVQGFIGWFLLTIFSVSLINQVLG